MRRAAAVCLVLAAACAAAACRQDVRPRPRWPQCFEVDPGQKHNPAGDVTHLRATYRDGTLVTDNVHVHPGGATLTTRVTIRRFPDHLEAESGGHLLEAMLIGPEASPTGWELAFHEGDWQFRDRIDIRGDHMTLTSTDYEASGPVVAKLTFHRASCADVDAAIAKAGPGL